jgi:hypothetical protein
VLEVSIYRYPLPDRTPSGGVVDTGPELLVLDTVLEAVLKVDVGALLPDFGRYLMPVWGQVEAEPTGSTGVNVPV